MKLWVGSLISHFLLELGTRCLYKHVILIWHDLNNCIKMSSRPASKHGLQVYEAIMRFDIWIFEASWYHGRSVYDIWYWCYMSQLACTLWLSERIGIYIRSLSLKWYIYICIYICKCQIRMTHAHDGVNNNNKLQWNLSVTTPSTIKFISCDLFSNVF